jgi:uncharacterized protein YjcR
MSEKQPHGPPDYPFNKAPRCGARNRQGEPCQNPRVKDDSGGYRPRCKFHGGALGSGAPKGNTNALKHGRFTAEAKQEKQQLIDELNQYQNLLKKI